MRFVHDGVTYGDSKQIAIAGMNYLPRRLSAEKRAELCITVAAEPEAIDGRFYVQVGEAEPTQRPLADIRAMLIGEIKATAGAIILAAFPEWKQSNLTARGVELTMKVARGETLTSAEQAEATALQAVWDWIKSVRDHSAALETEVSNRNFVSLKAWQQHDWPEFTG
ncbi:MAG: hypothetical protein GC182_03240 [Rhodopseudomonas sp.]|nr:hypothetical protein [Rhodopseudomonas sp.]